MQTKQKNQKISMTSSIEPTQKIKTIIGLGNPGPMFHFTPHNIGFLVIDKLYEQFNGTWQEKRDLHISTISINNQQIILIKPQTFMNNSGQILSQLYKSGIKQENILVVHDEIDFEFGKINFKQGGSARGHNGLRSLIANGGDNFLRLRVGVGRPNDPTEVSNFVTSKFKESNDQVRDLIDKAINLIENKLDLQNQF